MIRRDFIAALVGLDRSRWPVQPVAAENAIYEIYRLHGDEPRPCIWVDSPDSIDLFQKPGSRRTDSWWVGGAVSAINNHSFPGQPQLSDRWYTNDHSAWELLGTADNSYRFRSKEMAEHLYDAYAAGAFGVYEYKDACYVISQPRMFVDDQDRLHHERRAAVDWFGGQQEYFLHGVHVSEKLVTGKPTIGDIHDIENAEVRRVVIERFGWRKFLKAMNAWKLDEDPVNGILWQTDIPRNDLDRYRGHQRLLELKDPSTERKYFLRVPPDRGTALSARAWTFNKTVKEFSEQLAKET